jgi:hypothetical protein
VAKGNVTVGWHQFAVMVVAKDKVSKSVEELMGERGLRSEGGKKTVAEWKVGEDL